MQEKNRKLSGIYKQRALGDKSSGAPKVAATYSPTMQCSTIGDAELNDPVRNGKGWDLSAITTLIKVRGERLEVRGNKPKTSPTSQLYGVDICECKAFTSTSN